MAVSRIRRQLQRAETYLAGGHRDAAMAALEAVLAEDPRHTAALLQLASLQLQSGRYDSAHALTLRAAGLNIGSPPLAMLLLRQFVALGESALAIELCAQAPLAIWDSAQALATVAQQLSRVGAHQQAREFARAALARDPKHPPSLYMLGNLDVYFGETDTAAELLERCIAIHPGAVEAHWLLSRLRRPHADVRIDRIRRELLRVRPGEDEAYLAYALHNELHDVRDFTPAWTALERACRAKRSQLPYDVQGTRKLFQSLQQWTAGELGAAQGVIDSSLTPIFVVGLHRSGTTLVERILGGHTQVSAAGETYEFPQQLRRATGVHSSAPLDARMLDGRDRLDPAQIGAGYLAGMRWRSRGRARVTDKLPSNYLNLGFIAQALPHARIVCVQRDPIDVGLSSLRTLFSNACAYSYDPLEFAQYHALYQDLMAHWHRVLPGRILSVQYEDVVADPIAAGEQLSAFCGLEFEPEMIAIERSSDPVATASSVLVRDGIRRDRSRIWEAYAAPLQPMIAALQQRS